VFEMAGMDSPNPSPIRAYSDSKREGDKDSVAMAKALMEFTEAIPIVGGSAKYGSSLLGPVGELASAVPEAFNAGIESLDWDGMSKAEKFKTKLLVGKTLGSLTGVPMTNQLVKSIRASSNGGDWYETLLGLYVEKKGRGSSRASRTSRSSTGPGRF